MKKFRANIRLLLPGLSLVCCLFATLPSNGQEFDIELAKEATGILNEYCKACHGDDFNFPQLDVTSRESLLLPNGKNKEPFIVPGKPDESRIWARVGKVEMPPDYMPQPTDEQREIIRKWIADGANFPPIDSSEREVRPFFGQRTAFEIIDQDLNQLREDDIPYVRYFSLMHLWNDTSGSDPITDEDLRMVRASVSKMINSLSMKPRIVPPREVDENGTVLAVDLRDYGWTNWHWNQMLIKYPYGIKTGGREASRVYRETGSKVPFIRADWFVYNASRPPLYHELLNIPMNAKTLEEQLGVNIYQNFQNNSLMRAGFDGLASGVSKQNRMVERHEPTGGTRYYWKSYDILPDAAADARGDFTRQPLGPVFEELDGKPQLGAFEHDGGEIIYALPNGLQAYMLVDGKDRRIDKGPIDVVQDPNQHSGTPEIINGISCMGCHDQGMISWKEDMVRPVFESREGTVMADKVLNLFPEDEKFLAVVDEDREFFMENMKKATGDFLLEGQRQRDAKAMTKFYGDLLSASNVNYEQPKLETFVNQEMSKPGRDSANRKELVMQMVAAGNDEFDWGISIDDAVAMYEINPVKNETTFDSFADPVTKISKIYDQDVTLEDVARELGLPESAEEAERLNMKSVAHLKVLCEMREFQNLGLANLARDGGTITRAAWERAYGRVARSMGCGTPVDIQ